MAHLPPLEELDVDGAIREAADKVGPETRAAFLRKAGLGAGAVVAGGAFSGVLPALARGATIPKSDIDILNFALTLEYLEATFYQEGLRQVGGLSGDVQALSEEIGSNESEHVDELTKTIEDLGGKPDKAPELDFGDAFEDEDSFLELAQTFEDTGVSAYNGAAPQIQSEEVLAAAGSIVQVEGRHAALIRLTRGEEPAPVAFDETLSEQEVLDTVNPYIRGG